MNVKERIAELKLLMQKRNINAYILTDTDPHLSEYPADRYKCREWISGFTGSAGTVVVSENEVGLWTDSRYFLQAEKELAGSGIRLFRQGLPETPGIVQWVVETMKAEDTVAVDGQFLSLGMYREMASVFQRAGLIFETAVDLISSLWKDRPADPLSRAYTLPVEVAGESRKDKLARIRDELHKKGWGVHVISALDDIAWTLNIRGDDVEYNPVVQSYLLILPEKTLFFIDKRKLVPSVAAELEADGIEIESYHDFDRALGTIPANTTLLLSKTFSNVATFHAVPENVWVVTEDSIPARLKARKNATELNHMRRAHKKDAVAMLLFSMELENIVANGQNVTEYELGKLLTVLRSKQEGFVSESFNPIVGFNAHGAINHYSAAPEGSKAVRPNGLLLVDSGGQYRDGTTDITRVFPIGECSRQMVLDYTAVLKGHIALSGAVFPYGIKGDQLDAIARKPLWDLELNFGHGTGHGVGFFLSVHEGPASIKPGAPDVVIEEGMIFSNEPGLYREGKWGVRIENLIVVKAHRENQFGKFYRFETLTCFPYECDLIEPNMLSDDEIAYINEYHKWVFNELSPVLSVSERKWLEKKTAVIS